MTEEKKKIILISITTILMVVGLIPFVYLAQRQGDFSRGNILGVAIVLIIAFFMTIFAFRRIKDLSIGQPIEDELSKMVVTKAAAQSFYMSMYWMLAIMLFEKIFADLLFNSEKLDAGQAVGGSIAGMAIIFFVNWVYFQKKGVK